MPRKSFVLTMRPLRTKKRFADFLGAPLMIAALLALAAFLGNNAWRSLMEYVDAAHARDVAEERAHELERQETRLSAAAAEAGSARTAEEEIREKLRMTRPGEEIIMMVDEGGTKDTTVVPSPENWWQGFWRWVIHR